MTEFIFNLSWMANPRSIENNLTSENIVDKLYIIARKVVNLFNRYATYRYRTIELQEKIQQQ